MPDSEPPSLLNASDSPDPATSRTTDYAPMGTKAAETIPQNSEHNSISGQHEHAFIYVRAANQPIDYETKYPKDDVFNEMGPTARIWKVYLDECNKSDFQMVENWRDALKGLLVLVSFAVSIVRFA